MNFDSAYEPLLSGEAQIFRSLLRAHILRKLRQQDLLIPAGMIITTDPNVKVSSGTSVLYGDLEQAFERFITEFEGRHGEGIAHYLRGWPMSKTDVEPFVRSTIEETFSAGAASWGHIAAVSAFITQVGLNCARHRLHVAIVPLVNYGAEMLGDRLSGFIRSNGGWAAFTLAFRGDRAEHHNTWG